MEGATAVISGGRISEFTIFHKRKRFRLKIRQVVEKLSNRKIESLPLVKRRAEIESPISCLRSSLELP